MSAQLQHWITLAILAAAALVTGRRLWIAVRTSRAPAGDCTACGCAEPAPTDRVGRRSGGKS
ncbi:MAG TPA: hypothetical protein VHB25_16290 [Gemmatimonadaceae bacterium]|nr:hypothetical protein [Gemmatimonadaceae bacterium]